MCTVFQSALVLFSLYFLPLVSSLNGYTGDEIVVHIVPHTHDDPGWLVSQDQYYVEIVQWILSTVIPNIANSKNKNRKFSQVEMVYFATWYREQSEHVKNMVQTILKSNQLQFNLAGWCMNDEASPHFTAEIRQMSDGQQFVLSNFNESLNGYPLPRSGWHIDPSGSSYVTAGMWSQIGFDAFGINRINYEEKEVRKANKDLEFVWKGSSSLGEEGYIWTHIMDSHYCVPNEIDFSGGNKETPGTEPDQQDSHVNADYSKNAWLWADNKLPSVAPNMVQIAEQFLSDCRNRLTWYRHNNLLIPFGCDFAHSNAYMSFVQMDKLIDYINSNKTYNATLIYSTLYDYVLAVNRMNITWELEDNDFFIYKKNINGWRSGLFTSRADLKGYIRHNENIIRCTEYLYSFAANMKLMRNQYAVDVMKNISKIRAAQDVSQHHDAITGTEADYVVKDYKNMMRNGEIAVTGFMNNIVSQILEKNNKNSSPVFKWNINSVDILQNINSNNMVPIALYNTLTWNVTQLMKIRCNRTDLVVLDMNGKVVLSQINPVFIESNLDTDDVIIPPAKYNIFFVAKDLLPLSLTTYFIKKSSNSKTEPVYLGKVTKGPGAYKLGQNGFYTLKFGNTSNGLESITNNVLGKTLNITNNFKQYGSAGFLSGWYDYMQQDDPYIMRPAQDNRYQFPSATKFSEQIIQLYQFNKLAKTDEIGFITQPHIGTYDIDNRYMTHVCNIDMNVNNFTIQYFNIYGNHWSSKNNYADWIVFGDKYQSYQRSNYFDNKYYGSVLIQSSKANSVLYSLDLKAYNFTLTPMIFASIRKADCSDKTAYYSSVVVSLSNSVATINISRIDDMTKSWPTDIYLDWIAFEPDTNTNNDLSMIGSIDLDIKNINTNSHFHHDVSLTDINPEFVVHAPVILIQVQQVSSGETVYWSTNAINNNGNNFTLSMQAFNNKDTNEVKLKVFYWCFERIAMKDDVSDNITNIVMTGPLIDEIHQIYEQNYSQSFRVVNNNVKDMDLNFIDNDIFLGYIHDYTAVVSHYKLNEDDFDKNNTIYTCQNSLEYITRKYDAYCDERIACNFWPTSSQSYITNVNNNLRFSTVMNQAHGVGSYDKNEYELLLHRRCARDDYPFINRCLFPTTNVHETVYLMYDNGDNVSYLNRRLQLLQQYKPLIFYSMFNDTNIDNYKAMYNVVWSAMNTTNIIPNNINILDLRYAYLNNSAMILQLWNMFEVNENSQYSKNVTVDIQNIFDKNVINIKNVTEMQLTSILPLDKVKRLKWYYKEKNGGVKVLDKDKSIKQKRENDVSQTDIVMGPRDIRTFIVNI